MQKLHAGRILSDFIQVTVLVRFEISGLLSPYRLGVDVVSFWLSTAICAVYCGEDYRQEQENNCKELAHLLVSDSKEDFLFCIKIDPIEEINY